MYKCTNIYIYIILCSDPDSSGSSTAFVRGKVIPLKCPLPWGFHHYVGMPESDCLDVSENSGTPKSSHFNREFQYFHHPFWGTPIFGNTCFGVKDLDCPDWESQWM